jgi:hypothetical protein
MYLSLQQLHGGITGLSVLPCSLDICMEAINMTVTHHWVLFTEHPQFFLYIQVCAIAHRMQKPLLGQNLAELRGREFSILLLLSSPSSSLL